MTYPSSVSAPKSNATAFGSKGILGFGPPRTSQIKGQLQASNPSNRNGNSFFLNLFSKNAQLPNIVTFALSRQSGNTGPGGVLTIG
ncbi:hypothetical protein HGRIS_011104 [Hohenbuehelia grisea]|uniref:Uncharacterized protein n=1 Tax=Hohenbuehelia grisea TaxID=104357 RepID=A0ABR3IYV9_9AGAR